ncbi:iron ABC transporter substrate-binding protein [Candidatus Atribacteria bacterium HGW-Atribacteria-1]|nr:MAG: iron ABC transporter substrate-binding protein [Candidatus Atribacteria bacterium HGW-Atribacteria-1]
MIKKKIWLIGLCLVVVTLFLFLANITLAKETLAIYTTLDEPLARAIVAAFEEDTGIEVAWVRLSGGECVARLIAEKENPQISMWYGGVGLDHIVAKEKGLTTPYESPNAVNIPDKFKDKDFYWTGIYAGPLCFVSNTNLLTELGLEAPTSWADLIKPEYQGQIMVANPGTSGTAYNVLATMVQILGEDEAFKYLKALDKNIFQYTRSGSAPGKSASLGEVAVGIGYAHDQVKLVSQGYPLQITFPSEGTGYEVASISLVKGGPQLELAKKLYDWALTERAAEIYASVFVCPFLDVELKEGAIPISKVKTIVQDDVWAGANKDRLVAKWTNEVMGQ